MSKLFSLIATLLLVVGLSLDLAGQFNIKVGYNAQYASFKQTNALFETYNQTYANELTEQYSKFAFMHGIELGIRYHINEKLAFDAGLTSLFTANNNVSRNVNGTIVSDEWRISNRNISAGFENYYNGFGFGLHLVASNWKYLKDFPGADSKQQILVGNLLSAKINLTLQAKSGKNAFALKPFIMLPMADLNITKINSTLNGSETLTMEKLTSYGLAIVFYNGPQTN